MTFTNMLYANQTNIIPSSIMSALIEDGAPELKDEARQSFKKDMGLTMAEFTRALPKAVRGEVTPTNDSILSFRVDSEEGVVFIICHPQENRQLGSLSLPRMQVEIELCDFTKAETVLFFNRFDMVFMRMGG